MLKSAISSAKVRKVACAALATAILTTPFATSAAADIVSIRFCNQFPQQVFVALAYSQTLVTRYRVEEGVWMSRGWLRVRTGQCSSFDSAIRVPIFYYRGETDPYPAGGNRRIRTRWGDGDRKFMVQDDNFNFYHAEINEGGGAGRLEKFLKFLVLDIDFSSLGDAAVTVTFKADGGVTNELGPVRR